MESINTIRYQARFRNLSAMCTNCYDIMPVGTISSDISIDLNIECDTNTLYIRSDRLVDSPMTAFSMVSYPVIDIRCPKCPQFSSILLDSEIAESIVLLNKRGYYTYASCFGHEYDKSSKPGYIEFCDRVPDDIVYNLMNQEHDNMTFIPGYSILRADNPTKTFKSSKYLYSVIDKCFPYIPLDKKI